MAAPRKPKIDKASDKTSVTFTVPEEGSDMKSETKETETVIVDTEETVTNTVTVDEGNEPPIEEDITFTPKITSAPKQVKVHLGKDFHGCIGGVWYHLLKGQTALVPENVKRLLNEEDGMLKPLN